MKKLATLTAALTLLAGAATADDVYGTWKTEVDDGNYAHVEIGPCGNAICGTIVRTFNSSGEFQADTIGKQIVRGMTPNGANKYKGKVWRPSNDKIYIGKIDLNGNSLKLSGCVAGGLFCAKQTWTRL